MDLNLPWWFVIFYIAYLFMADFGVGAVLGSITAYLAALRFERFGRADRIGFLILGAVVGGTVNRVVVATM